MADLTVHKTFLVDAKPEAQKKWMIAMLQEKKMIAGKLRLEIENLKLGKIAEMEGNLIMFEAEIQLLEEQLKQL